jgi:tungstate transport system substrate-binding protein
MSDLVDRRDLLRFGIGIVGAASVGCEKKKPEEVPAPPPPPAVVQRASPNIRLACVPTAVEGGLMPVLIEDFEKRTGRKVELRVHTKDAYDIARTGAADIVISHYGHKQAEQFVLDGLGEWPRTVFSNQTAIIGPPNDPAKIRGLGDAVEAFARIAKAKTPFVVNDLDGQRYVAEILWHAAGAPDREGWWIDAGEKAGDALALADEKRAYVLWGLTPFADAQKKTVRGLEPLVYNDPIMQRLMVTIVVRKEKFPSADYEGAHALQSFLLEAATQAKMRGTVYPGVAHSGWAPAGRSNRYAILHIRG